MTINTVIFGSLFFKSKCVYISTCMFLYFWGSLNNFCDKCDFIEVNVSIRDYIAHLQLSVTCISPLPMWLCVKVNAF